MNDRLNVPSGYSFAEHITRGRYLVSSDVEELLFPVTSDQVGEWEVWLFHFGQPLSPDQIFQEMRDEGFVIGKIGHLLTFGEKYPEEQRMYPIVALNPTVGLGRRWCDLRLWFDGNRSRIDLHWGDYDRCGHYRFLGVRRVPTIIR